MSSSDAPAEGVWYPIHLGKTFCTSGGGAGGVLSDSKTSALPQYYTLHYSFKPSSIDASKPGTLRHGASTKGSGPGPSNNNTRVSLQLGNNQPGKPNLEFEGHDEACRELDCVLLFDGNTLRLERLHHSVRNIQLQNRSLNSRPEKPNFFPHQQHSRPVSPLPPEISMGAESGAASPASLPSSATPPAKRMSQSAHESLAGPGAEPRHPPGAASRPGSSASQGSLPRSPLLNRHGAQDSRGTAAAGLIDSSRLEKKKPGRKRNVREEDQTPGISSGMRAADASVVNEAAGSGQKRKTGSGEASSRSPVGSAMALGTTAASKPNHGTAHSSAYTPAANPSTGLASSRPAASSAGRGLPRPPEQIAATSAEEQGGMEEGVVGQEEEVLEEEVLLVVEEEVDFEIVEEEEEDVANGEPDGGAGGTQSSDGEQGARSLGHEGAADKSSKDLPANGAQHAAPKTDGSKGTELQPQSSDSTLNSKDESGSDDESSDSESDEDGEAEDDDSGSEASDDI